MTLPRVFQGVEEAGQYAKQGQWESKENETLSPILVPQRLGFGLNRGITEATKLVISAG